ncbi:hypothetical protein Rsub_03246 [Raphidocelis subcapitata]|uniref:NAD(P)-binding domain-containing protein n=1 Tax=Raphidocelis subcapitata TaxID=307507 RepID=A0A2V0NSR5_9CHLO|nr:hypothetical protein Rsub_03246 [Raphidocelis subcapitata]|eukprot:GBF90674.1 hypothetical protein Rsub_03246 [Raphidocelis subcapitata]
MPKAVIFGATGAVGSQLYAQLAGWGNVVTVGRRAPPDDTAAAAAAGAAGAAPPPGRSVRHIVLADLTALPASAEARDAMAGADAAFIALGTTRGDAGSAEAFRRVDLDFVAAAAQAAKSAGVRYVGLVSAQGANPNLWATNWKLLHPLLYSKTKGEAEEAVKAAGFPAVGIFRPGLLERGAAARSGERLFAGLVPSVPVAGVAAAMIADAERFLTGGGRAAGVRVFEMAAIQKAAAAGAAPE